MKSIVTGGKRFRLLGKAGIFWAWQLSPSELSNEDRVVVLDHSYETCLKAFVQEDSLRMREDVYCHLFMEDSLLVAMDSDPTLEGRKKEANIIAFLTCRDLFFEGKKILYLISLRNSSSVKTFTPSFLAFSSLEPAFSPATR
jgi:hypothetical protein